MPTKDVLERAESEIERNSKHRVASCGCDRCELLRDLAAEVRELRRFREFVGEREKAKWEQFRAAMEAER